MKFSIIIEHKNYKLINFATNMEIVENCFYKLIIKREQ